MMGVMTSFARRSLAKNRMRTVASIIGIALSVALITAIWTTVASLQQGLCQRTIATEGWWQVYLQGATDKTVDALEQSDSITDAAASRDGGIAWFSEGESETLGAGLIVKSLPQVAKGQVERDGMGITRLPEVVEGRAPEAAGEVMLPERLRGTALGAAGAGDGAEGADAGGVGAGGAGAPNEEDAEDADAGAKGADAEGGFSGGSGAEAGESSGSVDAGGVSSDGALALGGVVELDVCRYAPAQPEEHGVASTDGAVQQILAGGAVVDAQGVPVEGYGGARRVSEGDRARYGGGEDAAAMRLVSKGTLTFTVVGFYDDTGTKFVGNDFAVSGMGASFAITAPGDEGVVAGKMAADADGPAGAAGAPDAAGSAGAVGSDAAGASGSPSGIYTDVWASTQGFSSIAEITEFASGLPGGDRGLAGGGPVVYTHGNLTRYQGIDSGSLLQDSLTVMAGILALVVAVASVSLIYNSFSISVAERTRQFGLLASLGASKRQLRRSVLAEALMLGAAGIPCGMLLGIGGTAAVLRLTGAGFAAMLDVDEGLPLVVDPAALAISAVLSLAALLVSAWIPALRAGRVSAVDAIRQVQDVRLSRRAQRKAAKAVRRTQAAAASAAGAPSSAGGAAGGGESGGAAFGGTVPAPFSRRTDGGLWGLVAGVPGIIAHRNLSRQSSRGRIVVASLAVSVVLVVTAGAVALTMDPLANRAGSAAGALSDADVTLMASASDIQNSDLHLQGQAFERLIDDASRVDGVRLAGSVRQGGMEVRIPAGMLTDAGRAAIQGIHDQGSAEWVPQPFGAQGDYFGQADVFYLDEASFVQLAESLGVGDLDFADPEHPRAIALDTFQGVSSNATYVDVKPFAQTGTIDAYFGATVPEGYASLGVVEGADGAAALGLLDRSTSGAAEPTIERVPLAEAGESIGVDVVALAPDTPGMASVMSASRNLPVLLMSDGILGAARDGADAADQAQGAHVGAPARDDVGTTDVQAARAASAIEAASPFTYSWANVALTADDPAQATEQLEGLARDFPELAVNVVDLNADAESNRLAVQTVQVFILCFTVIMALIAVANVFNTLTNSIILRTREFAVLKSAGMGDAAFARMLVCECGSYALRGLVAGLALAVLVAWALYQALGIAFTGVAFSLPWAHIGAAVALVLVVLVISVAFALRKSHAANVVEALRADAV